MSIAGVFINLSSCNIQITLMK